MNKATKKIVQDFAYFNAMEAFNNIKSPNGVSANTFNNMRKSFEEELLKCLNEL